MLQKQIAIYIRVSRSFVNEGLFGFTMARIKLLLLALLAFSFSMMAMSVNAQGGGEGEVQHNCESFLQ